MHTQRHTNRHMSRFNRLDLHMDLYVCSPGYSDDYIYICVTIIKKKLGDWEYIGDTGVVVIGRGCDGTDLKMH